MILFGRDAEFTFIATEERRSILEKMLYRRMILEFGIFRLGGTSKRLLALVSLTTPMGKVQDTAEITQAISLAFVF